MREVATSQEKYQKAICYQVEDSGKQNEVHFRGKMKPIDLGMCMQIYPDKNMYYTHGCMCYLYIF